MVQVFMRGHVHVIGVWGGWEVRGLPVLYNLECQEVGALPADWEGESGRGGNE